MTGPVIGDDDRAAYLGHLERADEDGAVALATRLLDRGVPADRILLELVGPAQSEVGRRWAQARWSVAQEHAATHISERVVAAVAQRGTPGRATRGELVMSCVDGEWHALPARLCAEVLRLDGWAVRFLGANVPTAHLIGYLQQVDPQALLVSCSLPTRLPQAHRAIQAAQESGLAVLAGGAGFGPNGRWAHRLGADATAASADQARAALATWPPPRPTPPDLTHLADDEHILVAKRRSELVDRALAALADRFPPVARYTPAQLESTVDDLGHIVDFLTAALYVDDRELFTGFVDWLAGILTVRHVPAVSVAIALDAYAAALYDSPRVRRVLAAGRSRL